MIAQSESLYMPQSGRGLCRRAWPTSHHVFSEKYKAAEYLVLPQSGAFYVNKLVNFQTEEVLENYKAIQGPKWAWPP